MDCDQDTYQIQIVESESFKEGFDPDPDNLNRNSFFANRSIGETSDEEVRDYEVEQAIWSDEETQTLINLFFKHQDELQLFKKKKDFWMFIAKELEEYGFQKSTFRCSTKWKNMLRTYKHCKVKGSGKFKYFNELDKHLSRKNIPVVIRNSFSNEDVKPERNMRTCVQNDGYLCRCRKTEKQKRHEDRMALMKMKIKLEERKVEAFEDYIRFLKTNTFIKAGP